MGPRFLFLLPRGRRGQRRQVHLPLARLPGQALDDQAGEGCLSASRIAQEHQPRVPVQLGDGGEAFRPRSRVRQLALGARIRHILARHVLPLRLCGQQGYVDVAQRGARRRSVGLGRSLWVHPHEADLARLFVKVVQIGLPDRFLLAIDCRSAIEVGQLLSYRRRDPLVVGLAQPTGLDRLHQYFLGDLQFAEVLLHFLVQRLIGVQFVYLRQQRHCIVRLLRIVKMAGQ